MASRSNTRPFFQKPGRRSFLRSLASLGLTARTGKSERKSETIYRFLTPECEVRMSVQYFGNSLTKDFRFRDRLTNRAFCLSANGEENRNCLPRFSGSMAIALYHFRPHSHISLNLRERVLTIDHDSRMSPRPPLERVLAVERQVVSDINAFVYNRDDPQQAASNAKPVTLWCLLRQDLYLNDQPTAFLILHWKHTVNFISLVDVIPGDGTQLISE